MLPKIVLPSTVVTLPVSGDAVRVYAYDLNQEKNLLIAKDAGSESDVMDAILQLLKHCVPEKNVESYCVPDIITMFINILDISKGSTTNLVYSCQSEVDGKVCGAEIPVTVNIKNIKMSGTVSSGMISITDSISVHMKYPSMKTIKELEKYDSDDILYTLKMYSLCIDEVYNGEDVTTEFSEKEIFDWMMTLPRKALTEFSKFFENMPTLSMKVDIICPKCGNKETIDYKGLDSFFISGTQE